MQLPRFTRIMNLHPAAHIAATIASAGAFMAVKTKLDSLYLASKHPVDYATGQLAFGGETILGYYDSMRLAGTFGIYVQTQVFDFAFIACVMAVGMCIGTLIARMTQAGQWGHRLGLFAAVLAITGGLLDATENLMSFVLMQFDTSIPQILAVIYSTCAALKFAALTGAMMFALCALILTGAAAVLGMLRR